MGGRGPALVHNSQPCDYEGCQKVGESSFYEHTFASRPDLSKHIDSIVQMPGGSQHFVLSADADMDFLGYRPFTESELDEVDSGRAMILAEKRAREQALDLMRRLGLRS